MVSTLPSMTPCFWIGSASNLPLVVAPPRTEPISLDVHRPRDQGDELATFGGHGLQQLGHMGICGGRGKETSLVYPTI
jgi:hypothetical protein